MTRWHVRTVTLALGAAIAAAWLLGPTTAWGQTSPTPQPLDAVELADAYLRDDVKVAQEGKTQYERNEAARRIAGRSDNAARVQLQSLLAVRPIPQRGPSTPLAAAKALAEATDPSPAVARLMGELLAADPLHSEAASAALLNLRTDEAFAMLRNFLVNAQPNQSGVRQAALRPTGASFEKRVAELLITLLSNPREVPPVRTAAADALAEMTQIQDNGRDFEAWRRWWQQAGAASDVQFRADILERQRRRKTPQTLTDIDALLARLYELTTPASRPDMVRRLLDSPDPPFRVGALRLSYTVWQPSGRLPAPGSETRLREMVRDSSALVRAEAAFVIRSMNDKEALIPVLGQLSVESDIGVRIKLAQALVTIGDVRAVPELLRQLNQRPTVVAVVAAESLAKLGDQIRQQPALRTQVAAAAVQAMDGLGKQDPTGDLRGACVETLSSLRDPQQQRRFLDLLDNKETPRTRIAALGGLAGLGNTATGDQLIRYLQTLPVQGVNGEREASVRLAALVALRSVGTFTQDRSIYDISVNPALEPDPGNRKAAWDTFVALVPQGSVERLNFWADLLNNEKQFERRVPVLQEILKKLLEAGDEKGAAVIRTQIGDSYMKMQSPQPKSAVDFYRNALDFWLSAKDVPNSSISNAGSALLEAYLEAQQYVEAVDVVAQVTRRDLQSMQTLMGRVTNKAEQLIREQRPREAERLLEAALQVEGVGSIKSRLENLLIVAKRTPTPTP